jgi:LuxR family maltose regulon positive regulatory protein
LCNAVTGRDDSQTVLEALEAANLFLMPLDHRREWYRYYRLFAEFLRAMLPPNEAAALHRRAATWYEAQGQIEEAVAHALAGALGTGEWDEAARLVELGAATLIHRGALGMLRGWLDALPDALIRGRAGLATVRGWLAVMTGDMPAAAAYAGAAGAAAARDAQPQTGELLLLRAYVAVGTADYAAVARLAGEALNALENQPQWRLTALWAMAEAQERGGRVTDAIATLRKAEATARALNNQLFAALAEASLAVTLNEHGARREAQHICERALARHIDAAGRVSPSGAILLGRLAQLEYEANALASAREHAAQLIELAEEWAQGELLGLAYGLYGMVLCAGGETEDGVRYLRRARECASDSSLAHTGWIDAYEVSMALRTGEWSTAKVWAVGRSVDVPLTFIHLDENLAYARLLLAEEAWDDAERWLARLDVFFRERELYRWTITVDILRARMLERMGRRALALHALNAAVERAAPEGYARAFLDEDADVLALLPFARAAAPAFIDSLLNAAHAPPRKPLPDGLLDSLSEREVEVLRLIDAGLSNADIAGRLFITVGTVKRHINHIYSKLDVRSRTQAIVRARELRLLDNV